MKTIFRLSLVSIFFFSFSLDSYAYLEFCNKTAEKIWIAVGYHENGKWYAKGWWSMEPGACTIPIGGDLNNRYYYYYAENSSNGKWTGDTYFCTNNKGFTIEDGDCNSRGYESKGFKKLDVGNSNNFTLSFTPSTTIKQNKRLASPECNNLDELLVLTAPIFRKFANIAIPQEIYRRSGIPITSSAKMQFAVHRNGNINVRQNGVGNRGQIIIDIPIRIVDARVDWREDYEVDLLIGSKSYSISHHEDIKGMAITLHSTIDYNLSGGTLNTKLNNNFSWQSKPYFHFMGFKITFGSYCEPYINDFLDDYNYSWYNAVDPLLQTFVNGNCTWKEQAKKLSKKLNAYQPSQVEVNKLQQLVRKELLEGLN